MLANSGCVTRHADVVSAESLINDHPAAIWQFAGARRNQLVADALMRSLFVIVVNELTERAPQMFLAEQDQLAQALSLHGLHPSFRERVHARWSGDRGLAECRCSSALSRSLSLLRVASQIR
jgi:hypothetical protein